MPVEDKLRVVASVEEALLGCGKDINILPSFVVRDDMPSYLITMVSKTTKAYTNNYISPGATCTLLDIYSGRYEPVFKFSVTDKTNGIATGELSSYSHGELICSKAIKTLIGFEIFLEDPIQWCKNSGIWLGKVDPFVLSTDTLTDDELEILGSW